MPSNTSRSSPSQWWYGVLLFPLSVVLGIISRQTLVLFVRNTGSEEPLVPIGWFVLSFLTDLVMILLSLVILVSLLLDIRKIRKAETAWRPHWIWLAVGVLHIIASVFNPLFVASVPLLIFYLYRRGVQVGAPKLAYK